jgi:pimeloyl-ACP methyl ester carboxylesterase
MNTLIQDPSYRYAYLHGFASSPRSRKGTLLAVLFGAHGLILERPDLARPSFARLTISAALQAMDELDDRTDRGLPWRLVGSSLGGYLAARWAEEHPQKVDRLVLLCPGFDMATTWPRLVGEEGMRRWREAGALEFPDATGQPTPVHWGLMEDLARHPAWPEVPCPTRILHGTRDVVVPHAYSEQYAAARPHVTLVSLDDEHPLDASYARLEAEVRSFFELEG